MFPWASVRHDETNQGGIHQFVAAGIWQQPNQDSNGTSSETNWLEQLFTAGPLTASRMREQYAESQLHEKLLKKVFHARINESIKQYKATEMKRRTKTHKKTPTTFLVL
jgi:hypothetical protein